MGNFPLWSTVSVAVKAPKLFFMFCSHCVCAPQAYTFVSKLGGYFSAFRGVRIDRFGPHFSFKCVISSTASVTFAVTVSLFKSRVVFFCKTEVQRDEKLTVFENFSSSFANELS